MLYGKKNRKFWGNNYSYLRTEIVLIGNVRLNVEKFNYADDFDLSIYQDLKKDGKLPLKGTDDDLRERIIKNL